MKFLIISATLVTLMSGFVLSLTAPASAIPAFARKYHTTCARCHSVVPRLNNYGWNFKLRGFHVPGDEEIGKMATSEDKNLSLLDQVPLAVRVLGNVQWGNAKGAQGTSSIDSEIDLLSGGTLTRRMGYWAELDTSKNPDGSFGIGIGNVRAIFPDLMKNNPTALNMQIGKFNMDEFGISTGRILTQNPYAIYSIGDAIGNFPESDEVQGITFYGAINTGIGKGVAPEKQKAATAGQVSKEDEAALEAALKDSATTKPAQESPELIAVRAVLDVLVTKGTITQADADKTISDLAAKLPPPPTPPAAAVTAPTPEKGPVSLSKSDYDVRKGLFYQAGLVTRGADNNSEPQGYARLIYADRHDWWVGPIAYIGANNISGTGGFIAGSPSTINHFSRTGLEASFSAGQHRDVAGVSRKAIDILLAGQYGVDTNVDGTGFRVEHGGWFAEGSYIISDQNLIVLRWDKLDSRQMPGIDVNSITINYTRYLQRNLKVGLEFVPDLIGNSATHVRGDQYILFYDFAF